MENQQTQQMEFKPEEVEKYKRYYDAMKRAKEKYETKNRQLLNERARIKYEKLKNDPEYMKKKTESALKSYYKRKGIKKEES